MPRKYGARQLLANQAADAAVRGLFGELPGLWVTSLELAQCTGLPHVAAQAAAKRLATIGAIAQRTSTWRSSRSRTRRHFEFCHPGDVPAWHRLPERLEPISHPINLQHCRLVAGRASLTKEPQAMTEAEYRALAPGLRDQFSKVREEDVAGEPSVVAARRHHQAAEEEHRRNCEAAHRLRTRRVELESAHDQLALRIQEQNEARRVAIAKALIAGTETDVGEDLAPQTIVLEAYPLALADIDRQLVAAGRLVSRAADDSSTADQVLQAAVDQARLAEARRRVA